jgi:RNA polymerase sigma-70 factor (ECF subfamily)
MGAALTEYRVRKRERIRAEKLKTVSAQVTDAELVQRAVRRDLDAYGVLIERYQALVSAYTNQLLEHEPAAEDLAQEVFLRAFESLSSLREPERFGAWLKSIAWRECRAWVRRQRVERRASQQIANELAQGPYERMSDEEFESENRWLTRLEKTINDLSDGKKAVLALFYVRGLSHESIADFLEVPIGTVKRRLFEARQAVAESAGPAEEMDLREQRRFVEAVKRLLADEKTMGEGRS